MSGQPTSTMGLRPLPAPFVYVANNPSWAINTNDGTYLETWKVLNERNPHPRVARYSHGTPTPVKKTKARRQQQSQPTPQHAALPHQQTFLPTFQPQVDYTYFPAQQHHHQMPTWVAPQAPQLGWGVQNQIIPLDPFTMPQAQQHIGPVYPPGPLPQGPYHHQFPATPSLSPDAHGVLHQDPQGSVKPSALPPQQEQQPQQPPAEEPQDEDPIALFLEEEFVFASPPSEAVGRVEWVDVGDGVVPVVDGQQATPPEEGVVVVGERPWTALDEDLFGAEDGGEGVGEVEEVEEVIGVEGWEGWEGLKGDAFLGFFNEALDAWDDGRP